MRSSGAGAMIEGGQEQGGVDRFGRMMATRCRRGKVATEELLWGRGGATGNGDPWHANELQRVGRRAGL